MKIFITFGGGRQNFIDAGKRLSDQAIESKCFDKVIFYTDDYLKNDEVFWSKHKEFITNNKRLYGYAVWKPYIIKKTMETMKDGDILMYLDSGCELGGRRILSLPTFFEYVKKDKIIGTPVTHPIPNEKTWCKMDLLIHLNMQNSEEINTTQRQSGTILMYINEKTRSLVNSWYNISSNYHMIDDSPSISKNADSFIEHRHDQSIYSLLTKKYQMYSNKSLHTCAYIDRNRSGKTRLK